MKEQKYYWLKLKDDFFKHKNLKKLRSVAGGDTYTIIYLKMQLLSLKNEGKLIFDSLEETFAEELALELDEKVDNVKMTLAFLRQTNMIEEIDETQFILPETINSIGSETSAAERMRQFRDLKKYPKQALSPKTGAERTNSYRAKQECQKQHIPLIEDYNNKARYSGNYYIVLKRDNFKCVICNGASDEISDEKKGKSDKLCVHHILGFDEKIPFNNNVENLVTLCRKCHARVHRSDMQIPSDILESIGFSSECDEQGSDLFGNVTQRKELEIELEIEIDKTPISPLGELGGVFSETEKLAIENWIEHKKERREAYKPRGLKALITQLINEKAKSCNIIEAINMSMARSWKGIYFETCYSQKLPQTNQQKLNNCNGPGYVKEFKEAF